MGFPGKLLRHFAWRFREGDTRRDDPQTAGTPDARPSAPAPRHDVRVTAPQQFSPDGQWWWDGTQWIPAAQAPAPAPAPEPAAPPWAGQPAAAAPPWAGQPAAPPYGQPLPYGAPLPPQQGTDGKAIASIILSVLWILGIGSIIGVVLGHLSRSNAKRTGRQPSGLAMAGIIVGYLGIAGTLLIALVAFAFKDEIVTAGKTFVELQTASDAEQSYHDTNGRYTGSLEELRAYGYKDYDGTVDVRVISATATSYCLSAEFFGDVAYVSDERPTAGSRPCS